MTAVAHLPTQFVRTVDLLPRDDIDYPAGRIAAVECRSRAAHNLDTLHVGEVQAFEIDVVHRFARQALAIDQHEYALPGKTAEVQISHLPLMAWVNSNPGNSWVSTFFARCSHRRGGCPRP